MRSMPSEVRIEIDSDRKFSKSKIFKVLLEITFGLSKCKGGRLMLTVAGEGGRG